MEIEPDTDLDPGSPDHGDDIQDLPDLLAPARKARIRSNDAPTGMKMPSLSDSIVAPRAVSSLGSLFKKVSDRIRIKWRLVPLSLPSFTQPAHLS